MGCSESSDKDNSPKTPESPMDLDPEDPEEKPGVAGEEGSQEEGLQGEQEVKEETPPLPVPIERDPKHVFTIKFKNKPLGIVLTSDAGGRSAYVTQVNGKKNKAVKKNRLPLKSKLLKLNGKDVELDQIDDITAVIVESMKNFPLELTFCHPDGLNENEVPDPSPTSDYTK